MSHTTTTQPQARSLLIEIEGLVRFFSLLYIFATPNLGSYSMAVFDLKTKSFLTFDVVFATVCDGVEGMCLFHLLLPGVLMELVLLLRLNPP